MKTAVVILSIVSCIAAYDFEDHSYNQLISEQLFLTSPRVRRNTANQCNCCNDEQLLNYHASDRDVSKQCYTELNATPVRPDQMTEEQKSEFKCVIECIGKKKGYLDANGKLIKAKLFEEIKDRLGKVSWLAPKLNDLYENCLDKAKNNQNKDAGKCNDIGMTIGHCIWQKSILECPLNQQANPSKCEEIQNYLKKEKPTTPPPGRC